MVKDPATGKMVTKPEYGGTFTLADRPGYSPSVDPYFGPVAGPMQLDVEQLGIGNWALDRDVFDFKGWMPLSAIIRFKTGADLESAKPIGWQPIAVEYWRAIGVAVETQLLDEAAGVDRILAHSYDGFTMWEVGGVNAVPILILGYSHSESGFNPPGVKDPVYDELVEAARAATTIEEQKRAVIDADMRAIEQHWLWGSIS